MNELRFNSTQNTAAVAYPSSEATRETTSAHLCVPFLAAALVSSAPSVIENLEPFATAGFILEQEGSVSTQSILTDSFERAVHNELERIVAFLVGNSNKGLAAEDREILYANFWDLCT